MAGLRIAAGPLRLRHILRWHVGRRGPVHSVAVDDEHRATRPPARRARWLRGCRLCRRHACRRHGGAFAADAAQLGIGAYRPAAGFLVPPSGARAGRAAGRNRCAWPCGDVPRACRELERALAACDACAVERLTPHRPCAGVGAHSGRNLKHEAWHCVRASREGGNRLHVRSDEAETAVHECCTGGGRRSGC